MAEQKNSMPPRRPGGPGHGPRSHGYQRPQDLRGTVKKLLHYVGRYKGLLVLVAVCQTCRKTRRWLLMPWIP